MDVNGTHDAVVVGGGIAGLAAAWELRDRNVILLEARVAARRKGQVPLGAPGDLWLNFGAHVFGGPGSTTDRLLSARR